MAKTDLLELRKKRERVFGLCESLGFWNVRPVAVAKELGTIHSNIAKWKKQWIKKNGIPQIEKHGKELNVNSYAMLKELVKLAKDQNKKLRINAIMAFFQAQERYIRFLEAFGYKEKLLLDSETIPEGQKINRISLYNIVMNIKEEQKKQKVIDVKSSEESNDNTKKVP